MNKHQSIASPDCPICESPMHADHYCDSRRLKDLLSHYRVKYEELFHAAESLINTYEDASIFRHPRNSKAIRKIEEIIMKIEGNNNE